MLGSAVPLSRVEAARAACTLEAEGYLNMWLHAGILAVVLAAIAYLVNREVPAPYMV